MLLDPLESMAGVKPNVWMVLDVIPVQSQCTTNICLPTADICDDTM